MKQRNANLDAFRCLLMFLIVLYHSFVFGVYGDNSGMPANGLGFVFGALIFWHVDGFIALSGWFGVRFSLLKFFKIWGILLFYSVLSGAYAVAHQHCSVWSAIRISGGWYVGSYLMLMFMAPLLNSAIDALAKMPVKLRTTAWLLFATGIALNWAPFHLFSGVAPEGGGGCSFLTFVWIYCTVRLLVKGSDIVQKFDRRMLMFGMGTFVVGLVIFSVLPFVAAKLGIAFTSQGNRVWTRFANYQAPHVVIMAITILICFDKFIKLPNWIARATVYLAPSMLGVYLCHTSCVTFGRRLFQLPQEWLVDHAVACPAVTILLSALVCFCLCVAIDCVRRLISAPISNFCAAKLKAWDISCSL